jgi:tetratricopeptide (TPR) repeat protein
VTGAGRPTDLTTTDASMRRWEWLPLIAGAIFAVAALGAASVETPTVDEFAHVPAGVVHWRQARFDLYPNNPPLGKMWVAAPLALDPSVRSPRFDGEGVGWAPWVHGTAFQDANRGAYLSLMQRSRWTTIPVVLATAWLVYLWSRSLFGPFAGALSASLFLLCPTVLAHGHLATVDAACAATIFAAVFAARWASRTPTPTRFLAAGALLGLALAVKFSAIFLLLLLPWLPVVFAWKRLDQVRRGRSALLRVVLYGGAAWVVLNASMGFAGTFSLVGAWQPRSEAFQRLVRRVPSWTPLPLPRDYLGGVDALQHDIEAGNYRAYLGGEWSDVGWSRYYLVAFAVKESELVVVLAALSLAGVLAAPIGLRERVFLLAPPLLFLSIASFWNSLFLGIRYILPSFPFLFTAMGALFALIERPWRAGVAAERPPPALRDRRVWTAAAVFGWAAYLAVAEFPDYLSYFNRFAGGRARGADWLIDSNLDWGQDLHRLRDLGRELGVQRWRLAYFGHVDPSLYGVEYELPPPRPEFGVYAASVNFLRGMRYAALDPDGRLTYLGGRIDWMSDLAPTGWAGDSIALFDLRERADLETLSERDAYNLGIVFLANGDIPKARKLLRRAVGGRPDWAEARFQYGLALLRSGRTPEAVESLRLAVHLRPDWPVAQNHVAWILATHPDDQVRNGAEAVRLAEAACRRTARKRLEYLDTLAAALAETGRFVEAIAVCQEGREKGLAAGREDVARSFERAAEQFRAGRPVRDGG